MAEEEKPKYYYRPEGVAQFIENSIIDLSTPDEDDVVKITVRVPVETAMYIDRLASDLKVTRSSMAGQLLENAVHDAARSMDAAGYKGYEYTRLYLEEVK